MRGFNHSISCTGELIVATDTITLTFEGTNDENPSASDWHDVTQQWVGTDGLVGHTSITVTNGTIGFAYCFVDYPYDKFRAKLVVGNA